MILASFDLPTLSIVLTAALAAGFITGFAGFGTALVASGLWFHALPAAMVPPLVVMAAVAAHLVGLPAIRKAFDWRHGAPYLLGGALGVPPGVAALSAASPGMLRASVGAFLVGYALWQLAGAGRVSIGTWGGRGADGLVGLGGGVLGGFAGLSGPLPLIWLQLRGGPTTRQRAVYQPFNLIVLALAALAMAASGRIGREVLMVAVICLPATVLGAWLGARIYLGVGEETFRRAVLALLMASGAVLVVQAVVP